MPFRIFQNWLFDYKKIDLPDPEILLKYDSPINSLYILSLFLNNLKLNYILNENFNNINLWYLDKKELMFFIKKCVKDFNINRYNLSYRIYKRKTKLFDELKKRFIFLKGDDIDLLIDKINNLNEEEKNNILRSLNVLEEPKIKKLTKKEKEKNLLYTKKSQSLSDFINQNIKIERLEK